MEDLELKEMNEAFEAEIQRLKAFEQSIKEEREENPQFYDLDFQADIVNEFLKLHPEVDSLELKEKDSKR